MTQDRGWWRGAVIYQIYPRSFLDSDGDGVGDLRGAIARLDHVAALGADAIWLCPFYTSPQDDFGYDVADHLAVDPQFGTLADFDALLAAAHARGLKVLIDLVGGHTSNRHAWFQESRAGRDGDKADFYVWADPSPDGTPPNNWLSVFGGPAWQYDVRRRQYYLHHFLVSQPALNLANPKALDALLEVGEFWLRRGVDGFRLDAVDFLAHDPALPANPAAPKDRTPAKLFGMQDHRHDMMHPATYGILARIRALADRYGAVTLGEVSSQPGAYRRVMDYTRGEGHLHMAYTLSPLRDGFDWPTLRTLLRRLGEAGEEGWACFSFSNHDVARAATRWAPGGVPDDRHTRLLIALLLSLRGTACVYQGEELGLPDVALSEDEIRDPFGLAYWPDFKGRDGSRTPMPWSADAPQAGFTAAAAPWLPIRAEHAARAADRQERDPDSVLRFTRAMIAFRKAHPALTRGTLRQLDLPEPLIGFLREEGGAGVACVFNLAPEPVAIDLAAIGDATLLAPGIGGPAAAGGTATLAPYATLFASLGNAARLRLAA
ncbi:MAG TPA: alpha-glucosidase [Roseomonas sp.]